MLVILSFYQIVVSNAAFKFQMVDVDAVVVIKKVDHMQDQLFFAFVFADYDASAEISDYWLSGLNEGQQFRASVLTFGAL